jgi:cysteinyl-tRNA synthetase
MSKSKGETLTVDTLIKNGYNPLSYRYFVLSSHYQKPLEFSFDNLDGAENAYLKLKSRVSKLTSDGEINQEEFNNYKQRFIDAMDDNLNTSLALTVIYDVLKAPINDVTKRSLIENFDTVLSLDLFKEEDKKEVDEEYISKRIEERKEAKVNKDFALADQIRDELLAEGIKLIDTREGTKYEII